jgi:hypothetical protein
MTDKIFTVAGVSSTDQSVPAKTFKVRFANDMSRIKRLLKKYSEATLMELPRPMSKPELVEFLKTTDLYQNPLYREAIDNADEKYNGETIVKAKAAKPSKTKTKTKTKSKSKPNMDDLKARAVAKVMVEDADEEAEEA